MTGCSPLYNEMKIKVLHMHYTEKQQNKVKFVCLEKKRKWPRYLCFTVFFHCGYYNCIVNGL